MAAPEFLAVPPVEAIAFLRSKGYHVGFDWRDTAAAEHLASFTVAKAMKIDVLADIRDAVDAALAEGTTLRQFQQRLEPVLRAKGWWGRQEIVDP
ncbi:MAG: phage head morphogenesis protein, partial [Acidobacteria bacterium]|nr:phage head morphogenesis protein [Acidobacteriota bacterium]